MKNRIIKPELDFGGLILLSVGTLASLGTVFMAPAGYLFLFGSLPLTAAGIMLQLNLKQEVKK